MSVHMICVQPIKNGRRECMIFYRNKDKVTGNITTEKKIHKVGVKYYDFQTHELIENDNPYVIEFEEKLRSETGVLKEFKWKQTAKHEKVRACVKTYKNDLGIECTGEFSRYKIDGKEGIFSGKIRKKNYHKDDLTYISFQLTTEGLKSNTIAEILGISQQYASELTKGLKFVDEKYIKGADEPDYI